MRNPLAAFAVISVAAGAFIAITTGIANWAEDTTKVVR